ncbi:MAG: GtrA family protein [Deltaproteobacteria bacterium]|nr:GtrA family protein [Deltaproteobacteria bacterium]
MITIVDRVSHLPLIGPLIRHRFIKFATVGLSGTIVNMVMLHINQEILLKSIYPLEFRLKLSLSGAIFLATINNYLWNRIWTWKDRKRENWDGFFIQMGQYFLACSIAIVLQYVITIILSRFINYLIANLVSIVLSAIFVYVLNDIWTFMERNIPLGRKKD